MTAADDNQAAIEGTEHTDTDSSATDESIHTDTPQDVQSQQAELEQQPATAVSFREQLSFYDITPASADDLRNALNQASPIRSDGKIYHARALWQINWSYRYKRGDNSCEIEALQVDLTATIQMPQIMPGLVVDEATEARFDAYATALLNHEYGHIGFGVLAANKIAESLMNVSPMSRCAETGAAANALGKAIIAHYSREDDAYDEATEHGKTQGDYIN